MEKHINVTERWTNDNRFFFKVDNGDWQEIPSPYAESPVIVMRISDWSKVPYSFVDRTTWKTPREVQLLTELSQPSS